MTSGITTLFAKKSLNTNSNLVTFLRTIIIFLFTIVVVFLFKVEFVKLDFKTLLFLILSGIFTALLWICYFKALSLSSVNKVTPVDKTSIVLTLILSSIFFKERITLYKIVSIVFMRTYSSESTGTIKHNNSTAKIKTKNKDNIIGKFSN